MAKTTAFFEAYRTAQESIIGLKMSVLDVVHGHREGITTQNVGRLLGTSPSCLKENYNDVVSAILKIMEMEGTIYQEGDLWKVTDVT